MNCVVFLLFGFKLLGKGVLLIYVFIMGVRKFTGTDLITGTNRNGPVFS